MTLCIAAVARSSNTIVCVSDYMLSSDTHSIEGALSKLAWLNHGKWLQLFSGDPSHNLSVLEKVQTHLHGKPEDRETIRRAYEKMFQKELREKIEAQLLSPIGMTRDEFLVHGRERIGDEQFSRILYQIQHFGLQTEFLVAGFDGNAPVLLSISDPGTAYIRDALSFHAIGCGAPLAEAYLMTLPFDPFDPLDEIVYRVCVAKFRSEAAPGVGRRTTLATLDKDGTLRRYLSSEWEKFGPSGKRTMPSRCRPKPLPR
jgi:hypothetical protein